jgi:hypothetical protein
MTKLYILIDEKLSFGQKMSQAGHAIAQFVLEYPEEWKNETLVILDTPRFLIKDAISEGAIGFTDPYFKIPRAAAFTTPPSFMAEIEKLPLAS